jgi:hypothetical protein
MKNNNLPASRRRGAIASKLLLGFVLTGLVFLVNGCSAPSSPVDQFLFTAQTNTVPVVTNWTVTVTATNDLGSVETRNVVTWATNIQSTVTYQVSTNAAAIVQTGSRIGNIFSPGFGELAGVVVGGFLALWARIKSKKSGAVMAQGMETLLAVIETTKGKAFADTIKLRLVKDQNTAGVLREIAALVEATVDNEQAKAVARTLLETLPQPTP